MARATPATGSRPAGLWRAAAPAGATGSDFVSSEQHGTCAGDQRGQKSIELPGVPDFSDPGDLSDLLGCEHMAGPGFTRRVGFRQKDDFAVLLCAGDDRQHGGGLRETGEIKEIVFLAEGPIDVVGVIARLGGVQQQNALVADLVHERLAARSEVRNTIALPGGGRRRSDLPKRWFGRRTACGQSNHAQRDTKTGVAGKGGNHWLPL